MRGGGDAPSGGCGLGRVGVPPGLGDFLTTMLDACNEMLHEVESRICLSIPSEPCRGMLYRVESHICLSCPSELCQEVMYGVQSRISFFPI